MDSVKRILFYFLLAGVVITAVSCQQDIPETSINPEGETEHTSVETAIHEAVVVKEDITIITFAVSDHDRGIYEDVVESFAEIHPHIKVELVSIDELLPMDVDVVEPDNLFEDPFLMRLVQNADVINWPMQSGFVQDGMLLDLAPLLAADSSMDVSDFYPGTLEQYQSKGSTWALPLNANHMLIYYDKDLFDAAGVAYPEVGWSWDDFLTTAQALTLREGEEVVQWGFYPQFMTHSALVQVKAGPIFNTDDSPPTARLQDPAVIAAYQWLVDLYTTYEVVPYVPSSADDSAYHQLSNLMETGKIGMWPEYLAAYTWRAQDRNLGVVPFPVSNENEFSSPLAPLWGNVLAISAGTAHPQAAWAWVAFLSQQFGNELTFHSYDNEIQLPARQSVTEASGIWEALDEEMVAAVQYAAAHGFAPQALPVGSDAMYRIVRTVIEEQRDIGEVMAEAQQAFDMESEMFAEYEIEVVSDFVVAEPPSAQLEAGEVVVRFVVVNGDTDLYRQLAEDFHDLHPDIVVMVEEPNYASGGLTVAALVGDADVFQWWSALHTEADLAVVLPLQPLLSADPELAEVDFYPAVLDRFRNDGQVTGLPAEIQVPFLNYNKRLFDAAGVAYPQPGWTMDDFLQTAVSLTHQSEDKTVYGYVADLFEQSELLLFLGLQDINLIEEGVDLPQANFTDPEVVSALRWYTDLTTEYAVKPHFSATAAANRERHTLLNNDRAALWKADLYQEIYYDENSTQLSDEERAHIGVVPYPVGPEGATTFETVTGYYISADTDVRQAAWEWLKYLTAQEAASQYGLPARIAVAESEAFGQRVGVERAAILQNVVVNSGQGSQFFDLYFPNNSMSLAVGIGLNLAYEDVLSGQVTVEQALQTAQDKTNIYRQCVIENELEAYADYENLRVCLEEAGLLSDE